MAERISGYILLFTANMILTWNGIGINTWQWWAISLCFIIGEFLVCKDGN